MLPAGSRVNGANQNGRHTFAQAAMRCPVAVGTTGRATGGGTAPCRPSDRIRLSNEDCH